MSTIKSSRTVSGTILVAVLLLLANYGFANPTVGAHTYTNYNLGQNGSLTISTHAMNTQAWQHDVVCIGRGDISAFKVPTDNKGSTPLCSTWLDPRHVPHPNSGTALYASTVVGGHIVTASTAQDEAPLDAVEIRNGGIIQTTNGTKCCRTIPSPA
jgi:hypothetical protein